MIDVVYFSSVSGNTKRFVTAVGPRAHRLPLTRLDDELTITEPYVLITPTYGSGHLSGAVPKQVIRFLNKPEHRDLIRGVIACGNTNFGAGYGLAGRIIAEKCNTPLLDRVEIFGTPDDHARTRDILAGLNS